jgi:hypothetical protein
MAILTLQVTSVSFDFDDLDFGIEQRRQVVDSVVGNTFEVEVDDDSNDDTIADVLVEEVTDYTGWCVCSLNFIHVLR